MIQPESSTARAGCYVHLPFCDRICPYCDFAVVPFARPRAARYLAALEREIAGTPTPRDPVGTVFLGGGTPSALDASDVARVLSWIFARHAVAPGSVECTLEANPSRGSEELRAWRAAGVTRLSVGVQSLDDAELHRLGRDHTADDALAFLRAARAAGFQSVSIDLIAGVPGQHRESLQRTIDRALEAGPDHVSVYGLTIEAGTPYATWFAREPGAFPDDDRTADLLELAARSLTAAGYEHYEISNFARAGHRCMHNEGYWAQRDCIAYGMSASGYEGGVRYRNARGFDAYCTALESGGSARAEVERLDFARRVGEAAMLALRTAEGIVDADFRGRFGIDTATIFEGPRKKCTAAGLLETDDRGARLTAKGRLLANTVCAEFLSPRIPQPVTAGDPKGAATT